MHALSKVPRLRRVIRTAWFSAALSVALTGAAAGQAYVQHNLVSDVAGLAQITDTNLKNPWGMSFGPSTPFWISDQGTSLSTLYTVADLNNPMKVGLEVSIPTTASGPQGPTGQVFNSTGGFQVNGADSRFIFANLNGTISAWNMSLGTSAQIVVPADGAIYTGLAINTDPTHGALLYAANTLGGEIEVYDSGFNEVPLGASAFIDPDPEVAGLVPFNVQSIGNNVYVTYAEPGRPAQIAAPHGSGAVAIFDTAGNFIRTLISDGRLASPWGLALAPASFGTFGGDLLVGNFSFVASEINAFDPVTGAFHGTLPIDMTGFTPGGLWALNFGNGVTGNANTLFFTNGINGERNGLFAAITVPEPGTLLLLSIALIGWVVAPRMRRPAS